MNPLLAKIGVLAVAVALAFGAGFYTEHKFNLAGQVTAEKKEVKATAQEIPQSIAQSNQIQAAADTSKATVSTIQAAVDAQLAKPSKVIPHVTASSQAAAGEVAQVQSLSAGDQPMPFDLDTVRMLNAARKGVAIDAASSSDAEVASAPTAAGRPGADR
ncbi:hypothetical protein [Paraburkholderia sp.]|uniref:hypothetical protein n=1 Tax=Paraburkholderia sp. TaxID=1926495 RepID=UPI0039E63EDA